MVREEPRNQYPLTKQNSLPLGRGRPPRLPRRAEGREHRARQDPLGHPHRDVRRELPHARRGQQLPLLGSLG